MKDLLFWLVLITGLMFSCSSKINLKGVLNTSSPKRVLSTIIVSADTEPTISGNGSSQSALQNQFNSGNLSIIPGMYQLNFTSTEILIVDCASKSFYVENGSCIACSSGKYALNTSSSSCTESCSVGCETCQGSSSCNTCQPGYRLQGSSCLKVIEEKTEETHELSTAGIIAIAVVVPIIILLISLIIIRKRATIRDFLKRKPSHNRIAQTPSDAGAHASHLQSSITRTEGGPFHHDQTTLTPTALPESVFQAITVREETQQVEQSFSPPTLPGHPKTLLPITQENIIKPRPLSKDAPKGEAQTSVTPI